MSNTFFNGRNKGRLTIIPSSHTRAGVVIRNGLIELISSFPLAGGGPVLSPGYKAPPPFWALNAMLFLLNLLIL